MNDLKIDQSAASIIIYDATCKFGWLKPCRKKKGKNRMKSDWRYFENRQYKDRQSSRSDLISVYRHKCDLSPCRFYKHFKCSCVLGILSAQLTICDTVCKYTPQSSSLLWLPCAKSEINAPRSRDWPLALCFRLHDTANLLYSDPLAHS